VTQAPTLLIVEDECQQREALMMLFEAEGYVVLGVQSAEAAMERIHDTTPSMVISDVKLTGADGFTLFENVRKQQSLETIPFVFITAYNDPRAIEKIKSLKAVDYLTKPYNLEDLLATVRRLLPPNA
jgi:DNA-binding NtrC family response regulator